MLSSDWTRWLGPALSVVGIFLTLVSMGEIAIRLFGSPPLTVPFVAGIVTSVPFALLLVVGGYRLSRTEISADRYPRMAGWIVGSAAFFIGFFSLLAVAFFDSTVDHVGVLRWAVAVGTGGGFLIGFTNASSIERAVAAERATIRAEEAEERRELLEYLHALLRHEVLNSVTAIDGQAALLRQTDPRDDDGEHCIDVIQRQAQSLSRVIEDVRFLLDATEGEDDLQPVDLARVLREELQELDDRYDTVETETDLPDRLVVTADDLVGRLFANLFENAIEHNDSEPPRVSVSCHVSGDTVTVEISDNGPGLPDSVRENPFEPSVEMRADHGLGFAIVDRLIDRYGGDMEITEADATGTVVAVTLPRSPQRRRPSQRVE